MKINFWEPSREYNLHREELLEAIDDCGKRGELVLGFGDEIAKFEKSFAEFVGSKHAIMCGGGTHALLLAYRAIDLKPGDEVITTSHTFVATIDQIVACGAKPVLVDVNEDGLIDPEEIRKAITPQTKAIVPVHLEGKVCDMDKILEIAKEYNLFVIEDAAQAIAAKGNDGINAGNHGNIGCFSMYPAKVLGSLGNAGMCITNDDKLAERLRMLRCNWNIGKNEDRNAEYGFQLEPDAIQAAVLNVRLKYLTERLKRRADIAKKYDEDFKHLPIKLPLKQVGRIYQDYVIRVSDRKDELVKFLKDNEIGVIGHNLIATHHYPKLGLNFKLPKTDKYIEEQIRIPCNPDLTDEEVKFISDKIVEFYETI